MERKKDGARICVFDSGIGGLNLLKECVLRLPYADFFYIADNYNVPYGNRGEEEITALARAAFKKIEEIKPAAAVVACNTVTATCIELLRAEHAFPVIGIQPAVKPAAAAGGRCLVLATEATAKSRAFRALVERYGGGDTVVRACDGLAAFVEKNVFNLPDRLPAGLLPDVSADSVVLGCTHYAFVAKSIAERYDCPIFDGNVGTADHLGKIVVNISNNIAKKGNISFLYGDFNKNRRVFEQVLGMKK